MRSLILIALLSASSLSAADLPTIQLTLGGSPTFGSGTQAPVADAALFVDSTNFDGKSGMVRLQKGLTAVRLVVSSRAIGCETTGAFEKTPFLRGNITPMPAMPQLSDPSDYVLVIGTIDIFNPRKQATSTFDQALAQTPITKLTSMAPWVRSAEVPSIVANEIHMHRVDAAARTPSMPNKIYTNHPSMFLMGGTILEYTAGTSAGALHLQETNDKPPFTPAMVILRREGDQWTATVDIRAKEMRVAGSFPIRVCEPVSRVINEYEGKK